MNLYKRVYTFIKPEITNTQITDGTALAIEASHIFEEKGSTRLSARG